MVNGVGEPSDQGEVGRPLEGQLTVLLRAGYLEGVYR